MTQEVITAVRMAVKDLNEAPWNVNSMTSEQRTFLRADMKERGPEKVGPIETCQLSGKFFTCDGSQRLSIAKELKWEYIYGIFHPEIKTEEDARVFNYHRDAERGTIDPFRLAASLKWFQDQGGKLEDIAKRFNMDPTTVSRKISLLKISPEVKKQVTTDSQFPVSSIEPLATLTPELQKEALGRIRKEARSGGDRVPVTSRQVEEVVLEVKASDAARKELEAAVAASVFKKCPTCKNPPAQVTYDKLPWVRCSSWGSEHQWSLKTGKTKKQLEDEERRARHRAGAAREGRKKAQGIPQFVRTTRTVDEFAEAFLGLAREAVPQLTELSEISVEGSIGKKDVSLSVQRWGDTVNLDYDGPGKEYSFSLESKKYATKSLKDFKTQITSGYIKNKIDLQELEKEALGFLTKYAPKKPRQARKTSTRTKPKKNPKK